METTETERDYYAALFRRDYGAAQRLYKELARTALWPADHVVHEAHKCGLYDAADRGEYATAAAAVSAASRPQAVR